MLAPIIAAFAPQLIIIAAGFDAVAGDPLGGCAMTPAGYGALAQRLAAAAEGGRVVAVLEGGYETRRACA